MTTIFAQISNFSKEELQCRCGCKRYNYDYNFLVRLQAFRLICLFALIVTCGGRCIKHNKDVGGVPTSLHQCETKPACAVDVTAKDCQKIYDLACASKLFNEVEYHKHDGKNFVHLGWDKNQKNNHFKVI